ncbi:MAG: hypothetical protein Q9184_002799, partial [Pyrenodesmia sp. 2 TL-2023]
MAARDTIPQQNGETSAKGPDPAEFEPEFVIGDSEVPSRSGTPRPALTRSESANKQAAEPKEDLRDDGEKSEKTAPDNVVEAPQELPNDVRVKLRKLEKLESRYHELLRSYRLAHARVQIIDSFEASLKENTPLTSINDPRALVEYLNQLNLKGDMVLDELKRVSHDRDTYKDRLNDAEKRTKEAWDEVINLRESNRAGNTSREQLESQTAAIQASPMEGPTTEQAPSETAKSPPTSAKSRTGSLPSLSIFSPKHKAVDSPVINETREDLFSYDDEIPRLQSELKNRDKKIEELQTNLASLQGDLAVTRESTHSMVQSLEEATRELNGLRDYKDRCATELEEQRSLSEQLRVKLTSAEAKAQILVVPAGSGDAARLDGMRKQLEQANGELAELHKHPEASEEQAQQIQMLQEKTTGLEKELNEARAANEQSQKKADVAASLIKNLRDELAKAEETGIAFRTRNEDLEVRIRQSEDDLLKQQGSQEPVKESGSSTLAPVPQSQPELNNNATDTAAAGKKKNKKKKKGGKVMGEPATESNPSELPSMDTSTQGTFGTTEEVTGLRDELQKCRHRLEEKDAALEKMRLKLKDQDDLQEEIESLRDDLINVGHGHVQAKERLKELQVEKQALQNTVASLEEELARLQGSHASATATSDSKHQDLAVKFENLKSTATTLQTDLSAAQQLASSRFKELSELRTMMQQAQPELTSLRSEVSELGSIKEAYDRKVLELKRIELIQEEMHTEVATQKRLVAERDAEIGNIKQKNEQESSSRFRAEEARSKASQGIQRLEAEKRQANESLDKLSRDLSKAHDEIDNLRISLKDMERHMTTVKRDNEGLKEEIELKTAQHASAQSLMSSMRDQTTEMAVQMKEARDRCESLDEEVADAHRLLNERSREGETMRRLLAEIEGKADARAREMKDRMETAIEERDRAEDEASTAARRRARELDDLRNKVREAERSMKRAEEDKEELENAQKDWKRRREELEHRSEQSSHEAEEVRRAMGELRDALDGSERQAREAEKQKAELRRGMEDTQQRLEKLQKSNKSMADEMRTMQTAKNRGVDSGAQSSRSSTDSASARARLASPMRASRQSSSTAPAPPNGHAPGSMDFVYLKNVLLQFLEQKDRNHQKQLIPVLGMLLHFDR